VITEAADGRPEVRERLVRMANECLRIRGDKKELELARKELRRNSKILDSEHYFNILLLNPRIELEAGTGTRAIGLDVTERRPLSNLYYMRDQQAVTDLGVFMSRLAKPQRRRESTLTKFLWETLGTRVVHETQEPGTFEGGDFMPMKDFALLGVGDRTNQAGVQQMLRFGLRFDEVGVVHQPNHPLIPSNKTDSMINMHLDTYFNVASSGVVVASELLLKRAKVEVYHREGGRSYKKENEQTNLHDFMKAKGFNIVDINTLEQMCYASNFLCVRDGTILAVEVDRVVKNVLANLISKATQDPGTYGKLLEQARREYQELRSEGQFFPHKKEIYQHGIDAYPIILEHSTGGYGGAHCMTCSLKRG
jgi:arginine deiminase